MCVAAVVSLSSSSSLSLDSISHLDFYLLDRQVFSGAKSAQQLANLPIPGGGNGEARGVSIGGGRGLPPLGRDPGCDPESAFGPLSGF
jgi:hypothetical protein